MIFPEELKDLAAQVVTICNQKKIMVSAAESCTGGLVAGALTETPGASDCLMVTFVTYSDYMKTKFLGVEAATLDKNGAVSEETAREMAVGVLKAATSDIAVAITGIAGPGGGSPEKPVGTVHFATAHRGEAGVETHHERHYIKKTGRGEIRLEAVKIALQLLLQEANNIRV